MKKIIIFDLDETLTESKQILEPRMALILENLLEKFQVGIISGCHYKQMTDQVVSQFPARVPLYQLYLMPTSGAQLYTAESYNSWAKRYDNDLTLKQKAFIYNAWWECCQDDDFNQKKYYGEIAEDRGSQATFSMCGQEAPIEVKKAYDPDMKIRTRIAESMREYLGKQYSVRIGGTTSIDVSKAGIDKAYGIERLLEHIKMKKDDVLFIGDKLQPGGNDYSVKEAGYDCIEVSGPDETYKLIGKLIK